MKLYVRLIHTVPIDVDDQQYGEGLDREKLAVEAGRDSDLLMEFGNGPHDVLEVDWDVVEDLDAMEWLDTEHVFHTIEAKVKRRTP